MRVTTHTDILIGRIALERGLVTREQLADCLKEQASQPVATAPPLGAIFLKRGFIRQPDLDSLLDEQKRRLADAVELTDAKLEDTILGRLLVRQGLATEKQVYECLRIQAELSEQGQPAPRLGDLLVRKGYLTTDAVSALQVQPKAFFVCAACGARFSMLAADPAKRYPCKKCGAPLLREEKELDDQLLAVSHAPLPDDVAAAAANPARRFAGGRYVLIKEIGRGGMGVVWKAWQNDLERYVAIKQMSDGLWGEAELKRFFREAQTAASLSHSNIATIYEVGTHEGKSYIAMEYVDGDSLNTYHFGAAQTGRHGGGKPSRQLTLNLALQIVRDAALAVDYAHSKGVIHRDIKPHNIMLARGGGRVYVMDFGLAKPVKTKDGISMGDTILGTPPYMSPEQARGDAVDKRTDVYALGAVLYFVLTGHAPFSGHSPAETLMKVLADDPTPPSRHNPTIPPDLELVAMKCLEKDKKRRYDSAKSFAEDVTRHLEGEPVRARRQSPAERAVRAVKQHPVATTAVAVGAVALVLVLSAFRVALWRDTSEVAGWLQKGAEAAQKGDHRDALVYYEKALAVDRWNEEAAAGKRRAEQALKSATAVPKEQAAEWRKLADALFEKDEFEGALRIYERLAASDAKLKPRVKECEEALARAKAAAADAEKQAREAREALERERGRREPRMRAMPMYINARQLVAAAERLQPKSDAAADVTRRLFDANLLLGRCLAEDPTYVEAQYLRGQVRTRIGDYAGAAEDFAAALKQEPSFAPAAFGGMMTQLIRYVLITNAPYLPMRDEALTALDELGKMAELAAKVSTDPYERWASKAVVHMRSRNFSGAAEALGVISSEGRAQRSYYFILAVLGVEQKENDAALRELTVLLEFDPMAAEALFLRSVLQAREDAPGLAKADADRLVAVLPDHPYAYLARALANEVQGAKPLAAKDLEKAGELDTKLAPLLKADRERLLKE